MADITQLTGEYAASWLPWIMIPMICYILPFPVFAIVFLWIEREGSEDDPIGLEHMGQSFDRPQKIAPDLMNPDSMSSDLISPDLTSPNLISTDEVASNMPV